MRHFCWFGVVLIAGWCGCLSTGDERVNITTPQAEFPLREPNVVGGSLQTAAARHTGDQRHTVVRVFYGTDRARDADADPQADAAEFYTAVEGPLEFGFCHVSIPDNTDYEEGERPTIWRFEFDDRPDQELTLLGMQPVDRDVFAEELRSDVNRSGAGEAFVFVHGNDVDFAGALRQTARIAHELRFDGPPILYSWPSQGELPEFHANQRTPGHSQPHLLEFLQSVSRESGARKVHVIAYNTGTQLVASVLHQTAGAAAPIDQIHVNEVILAASDIDAATFRQEIAPRIVRATDRVTVYTSDDDPILLASARLHGTSRLGQGGSDLVDIANVPGIDVVDVASGSFEFLDAGHSADGNDLLRDVRQVIDGAATTQRGLQPHPARHPAWRLPTSDVRLTSHVEPADQSMDDEGEEEPTVSVARMSMWSKVLAWWPWSSLHRRIRDNR